MLPVHCHDETCSDRFTKLLVDNKTDSVGRRWKNCEGGTPTSTGGFVIAMLKLWLLLLITMMWKILD
jgi:hypothetical protein